MEISQRRSQKNIHKHLLYSLVYINDNVNIIIMCSDKNDHIPHFCPFMVMVRVNEKSGQVRQSLQIRAGQWVGSGGSHKLDWSILITSDLESLVVSSQCHTKLPWQRLVQSKVYQWIRSSTHGESLHTHPGVAHIPNNVIQTFPPREKCALVAVDL